jgi:hypothetical protein
MTVMQQQKQEQEKLQRAVVLEFVKDYCSDNGLSLEKLEKQQFYWVYGEAFFAQPSDVEPKGLTNDMDTMPKPTLVIKMGGDRPKIEQTEYTRQYLAL